MPAHNPGFSHSNCWDRDRAGDGGIKEEVVIDFRSAKRKPWLTLPRMVSYFRLSRSTATGASSSSVIAIRKEGAVIQRSILDLWTWHSPGTVSAPGENRTCVERRQNVGRMASGRRRWQGWMLFCELAGTYSLGQADSRRGTVAEKMASVGGRGVLVRA